MWPFKKKKQKATQNQSLRQDPEMPRQELAATGALRTHVGMVRDHNEDALMWYKPKDSASGNFSLAIVADGMGGHAAGEVASAICVDVFSEAMREFSTEPPERLLRSAMDIANRSILEKAKSDSGYRGMGTTCSALLLNGSHVWIAHVGDSRIYLQKGEKLIQLTEDDTLVNQLLKKGSISPEEAQNHPNSNVLTQAVGTKPSLTFSPFQVAEKIEPEDKILLCSDGLYDMVTEEVIQQVLTEATDLTGCADTLVEKALEGGGRDNVSVIVIAFARKTDIPVQPGITGEYQIPTQ